MAKHNTGGLWHNKYKKTQAKGAPDFQGSMNIDGEEVAISAWLTQSDHPKAPYINIIIKRRENKTPVKVEQVQLTIVDTGDTDDAPF